MQLGEDLWAGGGFLEAGVKKTLTVFSRPAPAAATSFMTKKPKNGHPREMTYRFFGEFRLFDFTMFYR